MEYSDNSPTNDELNELTNQILERYDKGKYDIESPTEKEKTDIKNRKKEIKAILTTLLDSGSQKKIVGKRVCQSLLHYYKEFHPKKVNELRRHNMDKKRIIAQLEEKLSVQNGELGRCEICRTSKKQLEQEVYDEQLDEDDIRQKLRESEESVSRWVKKYMDVGHKLDAKVREIQDMKENNHFIENEEWEKHIDIINDAVMNKDTYSKAISKSKIVQDENNILKQREKQLKEEIKLLKTQEKLIKQSSGGNDSYWEENCKDLEEEVERKNKKISKLEALLKRV
jgi:hypothetical protein